MLRSVPLSLAAMLTLAASLQAAEFRGTYMEARTCQVYTGPCFANGEVGLAGKDAILAWNIEEGQAGKIDLGGLNVVMVIQASDTLGFRGIQGAKTVRSVVIVDERASVEQQTELVKFARRHGGRAGENVVRVDSEPIQMTLDTLQLRGRLMAGKAVKLVTRKANPDDCICSNESAYYPPLVAVKNFAPGVAIEGHFKGRGLNSRWSVPNSRSAYMATFAY